MEIYEVTAHKKEYLPLLLLADEQEDMIHRYLDRGALYVLDDGGVKALCVVTDEGGGVLELKSLATEPSCQCRGYATRLIDFLKEHYRERFRLLQVGTGDSPLTLPFYEHRGFVQTHRVKDFFLHNYDHPIIEAGRQLADMVYLQMPLLPRCAPLAPCQALLDRDPLLCLDLTEPLRRGEGRVVSVSPAGALVALNNYDRDGQSCGFSLLARDPAEAEALLDLLPPHPDLVFAHEDFTAALVAQRFGLKLSPPFYQAAYLKTEPLPLPQSGAVIRPLTAEHLPLFLANYDQGGEDYFRWLLDHDSLFGAFEGDTLLGFVGRHAEGSIGLLEVLPPYRRRGLARLMQSHMIDLELSLGRIPFGQIFADNAPSLALQRSLGMTFSAGRAWFAA